jgi:hypothetical protein
VSRGGLLGARAYNRPGLREHHMRFNIDHIGRRKIAMAYETFNGLTDSMLRALDVTGDPGTSALVLKRVRAAMKLLVEGENGEFR